MGVLLAIVTGFASGVGVRSLYFDSVWPIVFVEMLAALLGAASFLKGRGAYTLGALFFLFCVFGMLRASFADTPLPKTFAADLRHRVSYQGVVVSDPDIREKNQRIAVEVTKGNEHVGMLAVMPLGSGVAVGDRVTVTGTLYAPQPFATENGRTFRYDDYLAAKGIRFLIEFGSIRVRESGPWYSLPANLARVKHSFLNGLDASLPNSQAALAGGVVIGGKTGLGTNLQNAFIRSGLVQIVVLSGYNVMIVATWVMAFLSFIKVPNRLRYMAGGAALLLFIGIAGITSTAVRAAIMAIIALYARATAKTYTASRALLVTVFLMLLYNPLLLCFDPGFDLSVAATAGIIWLSPIIESRMTRLWPLLRNALATTLAAQVSVLPLLLYMSGLLSFVALPANLVVNPVVPLAMAAAAIAGVFGMLFSTLAPALVHFVGLPALWLTNYIIWIARLKERK